MISWKQRNGNLHAHLPLIVLLSTLISVAVADDLSEIDIEPSLKPTVADVVVGTTGLDVLEAALSQNGLIEVLDGPDQYTLFAPTNSAFAKLGILTDSDLTDLSDLLGYHLTPSRRSLRDLATAGHIEMLLGGNAVTGLNSEGAFIIGNGNTEPAAIIVDGIQATNGVLYVIDAVLVP